MFGGAAVPVGPTSPGPNFARHPDASTGASCSSARAAWYTVLMSVVTSIRSSFCAACLSTFSFICKYPAQLAVNRLVGNLLRFAITLSIPLGSAALAFFWIGSHTPARPDPWVPVLLVAAIAFFIASAITGVFRCCIDTIFVCSFKDMEEHNPPKFMPSSMRSSFGLDESVKGQTEPTLEKKGSSTQGV